MTVVSELDPPVFEFFLRSSQTAFPGPQIAEFSGLAGGVEGVNGIDKLPVIWPGSSMMSPNHRPAPDVS